MRGRGAILVLAAWASLGWLAAARGEGDALWEILPAIPREVEAGKAWIRPHAGAVARLDLDSMRKALSAAPMEFTARADEGGVALSLPRPDGTFEMFIVVESPVLDEGSAAALPGVKTYAGHGVERPAATLRCDVTALGFHAQVLGPGGSYLIDPVTRGDDRHYASYERGGAGDGQGWWCGAGGDAPAPAPGFADRASGPQLRRYRIAVAATAEYTAFHGGTAGAQSAITTAINRVNQVYERDVCVRLLLTRNDGTLIFTSAGSDPYTNSNPGAMYLENQNAIDSRIGSSAYDIGHVFGTGPGGMAAIGVVCTAGQKARGASGLASPTGDAFWIDYVCHEIGHQFGASHTFNGTTGFCAGQRAALTAYEPGSGSTIMAYAGVCGDADNLQEHSDPYFHNASYNQINTFVGQSALCRTTVNTGNAAPVVSAGPSYVVPAQTAFTLTATASDVNGDALTYCWEGIDTGVAQPATGPGSEDNGTSPIFRSWAPVESPSRTFPAMATVLGGPPLPGEQYPVMARVFDAKVTVRDNRASGGGVNDAATSVSVTPAAGPFRVTSPNTGVSWSGGSTQTVAWNVAGTTAQPVSAFDVRIVFSADGGLTFPIVLAPSTPNDGSHVVTMPMTPTTQARVRVEAIGNIFFDVSDVNFTVVCPTLPAPAGVSATDGTPCDRVDVTWSGVAGAAGYEVWRNTVNSATGAVLLGSPAGTLWQDATAPAGVEQFYFVRTVNACGPGGFGAGESGRRDPCCPADFNGSGGAPDDADIAAFFAAWNAGSPGADFNGSGGTPDDADIAAFFLRWNAGC